MSAAVPLGGDEKGGWYRAFGALLIAWVALLLASAAAAQSSNSLEGISVSRASSGRVVVRFDLKNPPANPPASFSIASPPRIALDFLDTANGLGTTTKPVDEAGLRSFNIVQAGNRTRVVFNLNRAQSFDTNVEGNAVIVTLIDQPIAGITRTHDVIDAAVVLAARVHDVPIATSDPDDMRRLDPRVALIIV